MDGLVHDTVILAMSLSNHKIIILNIMYIKIEILK